MMRKIFIPLILILLLSCSKPPDFYNFRENLKKENIKMSPYYEIYNNLENKNENLNDWSLLKDLSKRKDLKIWRTSTSSPILNHYNGKFSEKLKLSIKEKNINLLPKENFIENPSEYSWTYFKNEMEGKNDGKGDSLLLSLPPGILPENVQISYLTLNKDFIFNYSLKKVKNLLIEEENEWVDDFNGDRLYGIKRKIKFADQTWDAIFAPPKTEIVFPVKISKESVLEFGYFLVPWGKSRNIHLSIYFLSKNSSIPLFKKEISPESEPDFIFEKIEIGKEAKGKGKIVFLTDSKSKEGTFFCMD